MSFDKKKFDAITSLITKGVVEDVFELDGIKFGMKSLSSDQEVIAADKAKGQVALIPTEFLTLSIISIDGAAIGDSEEERLFLRELLGKLSSKQLTKLIKFYSDLIKTIPDSVSHEDLADPLDQKPQHDVSTMS